MASLSKERNTGSGLMAVAAVLIVVLLAFAIIGCALVYNILSKPAPNTTLLEKSTTTEKTSTLKTTSSTTTTTSTTKRSTTEITFIEEETSTSTEESTTTTTLSMSELAQCFNKNNVKLYISDVCLETRCRGISEIFGTSFEELNVINCDLEMNLQECDDLRNETGTLGFPTWYVGSRRDYYPGATTTKIKEETGC